jgi:hypothetical protein
MTQKQAKSFGESDAGEAGIKLKIEKTRAE